MKKLCALIAVLSLVPLAHAYADGAEITQSGSYRLQYQDDNNQSGDKNTMTNGTSNSEVWHQRFKLGVNARAGEKLNAHVTLVGNSNWGDNPSQVPDYTGNSSNLVTVNEAYASWVINDSWMLKFGRGSATLADGRLVSANDFENVATAFDGALLGWDQDWGRTNFFAVEGANNGQDPSGNANAGNISRFYGVSVDLKNLPTFLKMGSIHLMQVLQDEGSYSIDGNNVPVPMKNEVRAGLVVSGDTAGVDYRVNYEMESGKYRGNGQTTKYNNTTSMIDADVGYTMANLMNGRVHVGYHTDTGTKNGGNSGTADNKTYDGFYYDRHDNAGLMDIYDWGNLTYVWFGVSAQPKDDINVAVDYYMFSKTEKTDTVMAGDNGSGFANTTANELAGKFAANDTAKSALGNELDLSVTKKYTNNFSIAARYGMFSPGDNYKAAGMKDTYSQYYLEGNLTF